VRAIFLALLIVFFIAPAWAAENGQSAFGLRTQLGCDNDPTITRASQLISCYRAAAITAAYAETSAGRETAVNLCGLIYSKYQSTDPTVKSDVSQEAELSSDDCYLAVAKIMRDPSICNYMSSQKTSSQSTPDTGLFGTKVSQDICTQEATNLANLAPDKYYSDTNNTNLCEIVFILPVLVVGALRYRNVR